MNNSYTVLARKYRSQDFASLIGQDVLVKTLTTAINTGRNYIGFEMDKEYYNKCLERISNHKI